MRKTQKGVERWIIGNNLRTVRGETDMSEYKKTDGTYTVRTFWAGYNVDKMKKQNVINS